MTHLIVAEVFLSIVGIVPHLRITPQLSDIPLHFGRLPEFEQIPLLALFGLDHAVLIAVVAVTADHPGAVVGRVTSGMVKKMNK